MTAGTALEPRENRSLDAAVTGGLVAVMFGGAIFGFFYAWVCSTMWGLDDADPRVAIAAMQSMNASVRNAVFFPAFFLTPAVMGLVALLAWRARRRASAVLMTVAALVYLAGGLLLTMMVNVPMNEDLAAVSVPGSAEEARRIWEDYSGRWQIYNQVRTIASGASLLLAATALTRLRRWTPGLHGRLPGGGQGDAGTPQP
ncbi:DUF1772 domain-containing protein [Spirillospora sp. NBC_00431]